MYEGDVLEGGIGSAIKISCPSYLGPNWYFGFLGAVKVIDMFKYDFSFDLKMIF